MNSANHKQYTTAQVTRAQGGGTWFAVTGMLFLHSMPSVSSGGISTP